MYQALWSCITCVAVTLLVTLVTKPKPDEELEGLVYSLTNIAQEERVNWLHRPALWGAVALTMFLVLQIIFW